ncbi:protein phosphatase 1 regulatory subunit 14D isoform X2 [Perognathus longimembris pacificus]|uniref:protein phosphatase 1 regulatory subunit 14D isoform X2 n=1 Tax=Perognathus longimembris pacificus TaxID=214514 RepID=UPI0020196A60|nr:protein phosphatase 1 regulatory subunit 14D isoform X2 [Perognathus longimembris pacificus]
MPRCRSCSRTNRRPPSPRLTLRRSWNSPPKTRRLTWRPFFKTALAPQSLLSLSCSVNSRNSADSADLRSSLGRSRQPEYHQASLSGTSWAGNSWTGHGQSVEEKGGVCRPLECVLTARFDWLGFWEPLALSNVYLGS